jgi:hypothetical protein
MSWGVSVGVFTAEARGAPSFAGYFFRHSEFDIGHSEVDSIHTTPYTLYPYTSIPLISSPEIPTQRES